MIATLAKTRCIVRYVSWSTSVLAAIVLNGKQSRPAQAQRTIEANEQESAHSTAMHTGTLTHDTARSQGRLKSGMLLSASVIETGCFNGARFCFRPGDAACCERTVHGMPHGIGGVRRAREKPESRTCTTRDGEQRRLAESLAGACTGQTWANSIHRVMVATNSLLTFSAHQPRSAILDSIGHCFNPSSSPLVPVSLVVHPSNV